jgi:hypothetical protein
LERNIRIEFQPNNEIYQISFLVPFPVSFPSDTGHDPSLQRYKVLQATYVQKCNFFGGRHTTSLSGNRRDAACRVSPAKINRQWGKYKFSGNAFAQFASLPVSFPSDTGHAPSLQKYIFGLSGRKTFLGTVETRRAACRQQRSTIMGKYIFSGNGALNNFCFFLVSFPSDTGHAPSLHFWRARLYKNTFLGCLQAAKPFCKP